MSYDVERVRRQIPALTEGAAHFDGPGGSQVASPVAEAIATAMGSAVANRGHITAAEKRADNLVVAARQAVGDLLGADPRGVVFGRSMTALAFMLAECLSARWSTGDEIVVTSLDHDANITPWTAAARSQGVTVKTVDFDAVTGDLPTNAVTAAITERTRLVTVTGASNLIGTRPDLPAIAAAAHAVGALFAVDGVHLTPHAPVDIASLGADIYFCSPYKFCSPHLGLLAAEPRLLESLHPRKLAVSSDVVPERFELGTLPYELLAGLSAGIDWIADLDSAASGNRRKRILASMAAVEAHEALMQQRLVAGLTHIGGVSVHAGQAPSRTPTTLFTIKDRKPGSVHESLAARGVNAPAGHFYALQASRHIGLGDTGAVRAGIAAYTNTDDVDRLLSAVADLAGGHSSIDATG